MIILDSSVVLKWFVGEEHEEDANLYLTRHQTGKELIVGPPLLPLEVIQVLGRKKKQFASVADSALLLLLGLGIQIHPPTSGDYQRIVQLVTRLSLDSYDACYVTLAERLGCTFVTADRDLVRKTHRLNFVKWLGHDA